MLIKEVTQGATRMPLDDDLHRNWMWMAPVYGGVRACRHDHYLRRKETFRRQRTRLTRLNCLHLAIALSLGASSVYVGPVSGWPGSTLTLAAFAFLVLYRRGLGELRSLNQEERECDAVVHALQVAVLLNERGVARDLIRELTGREPPSL